MFIFELTHLDRFMVDSIVNTDTIENGNISYRKITSYLNKATSEDIIRNSEINGYSISKDGSIVRTETSPLEVCS